MSGRLAFALLTLLVPTGMNAQQQQVASGPNSGPVDDSLLVVPITLNGQGGSLDFQSETPDHSYVSGGIGVSGAYTDNALFTTTNKVDNFSYMVQPHLMWSRITPKLKWNVGLNGGFINNQNLGNRNQAAENVNLDATWRVTEHVSFRVDDTFSNTTGLFSSLGSRTQPAGVGIVEQSNNTLLVPPAQRVLSNQSLAELSLQIGPKTVTGVRGTYWLSDYPDSSKSSQFGALYNARGYSVEGFYDRKFAVRHWLGLAVRGQRLETVPAIAKTDVASLLLYYSFVPTPSVTLAFFGGPEYINASAAQAAPRSGQGHFWGSGEGATLNWKGSRTSANLGYIRQLNDGGGLASPVTLQTESAALRQQLSRVNEIQLGTAYSKNDLLLSRSLFEPSLRGLSAFASFQQHLGTSVAVGIGYWWQRQDLPSSGTSSNANTVRCTVSYDLSHPLGK